MGVHVDAELGTMVGCIRVVCGGWLSESSEGLRFFRLYGLIRSGPFEHCEKVCAS